MYSRQKTFPSFTNRSKLNNIREIERKKNMSQPYNNHNRSVLNAVQTQSRGKNKHA